MTMQEDSAPYTITSRSEFDAALHQAVAWAAERGARRIWAASPDFSGWPLDDPAFIDALTAWVRLPARRLTLVGGRFDEVRRDHPRFTQWRRTWAHAVDAFAPAETGIQVPTLLVDDGPVLLQLQDGDRLRGSLVRDAWAARRWRDELDALLQRCEVSFAPTVVGL